MIAPIPALLLAALLPAAPADDEPRCRAELQGARLTTTIAYPDGYAVAAPWQVVQTQETWPDGVAPVLVVDAALDRVIEEDGITGRRTTTPLEHPITLTFEAPSRSELVAVAARTWCQTVLRARAGNDRSHGPALPPPGRIT